MRWMLLAVALVACKKQVVEQKPTGPVGIQHPDLDCPTGTIGMGEPPPNGREIYCARVDPYTNTVTRQGPAITWHSPTRRASRGTYSEGRKNGPWTYWSPAGSPEKQGSYAGDKMDGLWVTFHGNGEKASEGTYVSGREEGRWTFWAEDGSSRSTGSYEIGQRVGTWTDFDADDKPLRERTYRNGRLVTQRELKEVE